MREERESYERSKGGRMEYAKFQTFVTKALQT